MSDSGKNNYNGINAQSWAAMSLFLQFLRDQNFSAVHLEGTQCEDFDLVFTDGRKVVCESKARKQKFSYANLKSLLASVLNKKEIGQEDEILIICTNANDDLVSDIENAKYFTNLKEKFEKKGFSQDQINLLPKVKFWIVSPDFNNEAIYALFSELINFWVPSGDIQRFVDNILIQKIYKGSGRGELFTRKTFVEEVEKFIKEVKERGSYLNAKNSIYQNYLTIEATVNKNEGINWGTGDISAISPWELATFTLNLLKEKNNLDLQKWGDLWQLTCISYCAFSILEIFENNLHTDENKDYVLKYINDHLSNFRTFYRDSYLDQQVIKLMLKIIESENGKLYLFGTFEVIKGILRYNVTEFFYLKVKRHDPMSIWQKGELCRFLINIYKLGDVKLRQNIFELTTDSFDFTQDGGGFDFHAPKEVFEILKMWLEEDFDQRFNPFIEKVKSQYDAYYGKYSKKNTYIYDGWEHIGGGISFGGSYHASDKHFIGGVLEPVIRNFYVKNEEIGWSFIKERCISSEKQVSRAKPDFLNRAVYPIILDRYSSNEPKVSDESLKILKEWSLSKKGIPRKVDLICQALVQHPMSDEKKLKLVSLITSKYDAPINPFIDEIVTALAKKGVIEAIEQLKKWAVNPNYYDRFMFEIDPLRTIKSLLNVNFELAFDLFKKFLKSDYITTEKGDRLGAFDVAVFLYQILEKDYEKGVEILRMLESEPLLSNNQQVVYTFSLFNYHGDEEGTHNSELLIKIYKDVVNPFLNKYGNANEKVCERINRSGPRAAFVQFAARLAVSGHIEESLRVIKVFIDDPDPFMPNKDPEDLENKHNRHKQIQEGKEVQSIESVRGWCCWALMKCTTLKGRSYIEQIIAFVEKLAKDENYYVMQMLCFPLAQLARIRLTVLPDDRNVLFLSDNQENALKMAKYIESICFEWFKKLLSLKVEVRQSVEKNILNVLTNIRAINQEDAFKLVNNLKEFTAEGMGEAAGLFIYFAELRKNAYEDWKFFKPGLYDDLGSNKFDDRPFKLILEDLMQNGPDLLKERFAAQLEFLIRENDEYLDMAMPYFRLLSESYSHNAFSILYLTIAERIIKKDRFGIWYDLYMACIKVEKAFYEAKIHDFDKISGVYWWPSLYNSQILIAIEEHGGSEKFLDSADIVFSFPKQLWINESDALIEKLLKHKKDKRFKKLIDKLIERNPSKYYYLKKKSK